MPPTTTIPAADAEPGPCGWDTLSVALTDTEGAAGTVYSHLAFTNIAAQTWTLAGYPAVMFVDDRGHRIGAPVSRLPGEERLVTLEPGAYTVIISGVNNTTGNCLVEIYEVR